MRSSLAQRLEIMKDTRLFQGLEDASLELIAARLHDHGVAPGQLLYGAGERAENFYIVVSGQLLNQEIREGRRVAENTLESGDVFGERALLGSGDREAAVSALSEAQLLYMTRADFKWMQTQFPQVAAGLQRLTSGKGLESEVDFDWLEEGEEVQYVARKHVGYLWFRLSRALTLAIFGFLAFYVAIGAAAASQFYWVVVGGLLLFGAVAWGAWEGLDWRNDFYVVTDLRAVWLEQILLRSASRTEAPLANIQSVNVHISFMGRLLGFGDVIVRTYTGTVLMPSVGDPQQVKNLIEDYAARIKKESRKSKHESIRQAVRESLGMEAENGAVRPPLRRPMQLVDHTERFWLFKTRTIEGDQITYHKHWFALLSSLLLPALFGMGVLAALPFAFGGLPKTLIGWVFTLAFLITPIGVIVYRILDWQNDVYVLTPDSVIDTEKKPLGSEVTKSAPLANVLSLENHKVGIIGMLLNFGVVRINVGDTNLDFINVADPVLVQQDIFSRMEALKIKLEQGKADEEQRRMTEWLRVYEEERGRRGEKPADDNPVLE